MLYGTIIEVETAGLTSAIYTKQANKKVLVSDRMSNTHKYLES